MTAAVLPTRAHRRRILRALARHLAPIQPRRLLVAAGRQLSTRQLTGLRTALGALEQGNWIRQMEAHVPNRGDRFDVFAEIVDRLRSPRPLYLEFGVHEGRTLQWWSEHLATPGARFVGFDSFDGLPNDWHQDAPAGSFATGIVPRFDDPRVEIVPGWFSDTLPGRELPEHDELVVNVDCDLYSSTREVLDWLEAHLRPGTLVYFDDLFDHDAELRAVWEWVEEHPETVRPLSMARWGQHLLLEYR
ncbi:TylF/MycF/NovP-related O-methyltransferase [Actinomycetospora sp. C-140]